MLFRMNVLSLSGDVGNLPISSTSSFLLRTHGVFRDPVSPTRTDRRKDAKRMVLDEGLSVRKAAEICGLSATAVHRLVSGAVSPSAGMGRKTVMHPLVEAELACVCIYLYESNIPIHRALIQSIALDIALATGVPKDSFVASEKWFRGFKARHPTLASRKACKINRARSISWNRFSVEQWYTAAHENLQKYEPEEIWNCDDTSKDPEPFNGMVRHHMSCSHAAAMCAV